MATGDRVTAIVDKHLRLDGKPISPEARLMDDLDANSLDMLEMLIAFEEEFCVTISDAEAARLATVGDVIECLKNKPAV